MSDNSLIARLERHKEKTESKALIEETIRELNTLFEHICLLRNLASSGLIHDPAIDRYS